MAEMCLSLPTINEESRGIAFPHLNEMLVHGNFTPPPPPPPPPPMVASSQVLLIIYYQKKRNKNLFSGLVECLPTMRFNLLTSRHD